MTVRQLLAAADSHELTEWQGFLKAEARHQEAALEERQAERRIIGE